MTNRRRNDDDDDLDEDALLDRVAYPWYRFSWPLALCFMAVFAVLATGGMEIAWRLGYASDQGAFDVVIPAATVGTPIIMLLGWYLLRRRRG